MSKKRKSYELPLEKGPGEGLDDAWWEDNLLSEPPSAPDIERTDAGFSSVWEDESLLDDETEDWAPEDESLEGFEDLDDWDPLVEAEDAPLPAEVPEPPVVEPEPEPEPEPPEPLTELEPEDDATMEDDAERRWELRVISWAPNVLVGDRPIASVCSTDQSDTVLRVVASDWPELSRLTATELDVTVEGRTLRLAVRIETDSISCIVLGRDALAQARLLINPAQN